MSGSAAPPESSILTALQEVVDAWTEEDYATVIANCNALLKKRKSLERPLVDSIQRLLLQCYLQQKEYAKVVEWSTSSPQSSSPGHRDLVLYAQYRQDQYESVSQQASKETPLEQLLLAQSFYHLNQMNPSLRVYQDLLKAGDEGLDEETTGRMELLTNAVAVLSSVSTLVPYVATTSAPTLLEEAEAFLEEHPEHCDLALNVGTLQCLTGSPFFMKWLELAKDNCTDPDDMVPIDINTNWSRHFWQMDDEEPVHYDVSKGTAPQTAVAQLNQSLLDKKPIANNPHAKWNALQNRLYWYNRAVQQYQKQQLVECQESCQSLKKILLGGGKKKKGDSKPSSPAEWWWQSRIDVLLAYVKADAAGIAKLEERLAGLQGQPSSPTMDHATAYAQLHLHSLQYPNATNEQKCALLKSLPSSIQSHPAVQATLEVFEQATGSSNNKGSKKERSPTDQADSLFEQGQYEQAAKLYDDHLPAPSKCNSEQLAFQLKRVQALALCEQHEASTKLWETLVPLLDAKDEPIGGNGETLETKALPRTTSSAHKTTTPLAATSKAEQSKLKRSKESVLRQRARKREAYLKSLEEKGEYNPDRPTKPNAERWIPKHERSRARRRGQNNRSAQGGGSQADAQRLDAAARRAGNVPATTAGPSTANLKVPQGGRKGGRRR